MGLKIKFIFKATLFCRASSSLDFLYWNPLTITKQKMISLTNPHILYIDHINLPLHINRDKIIKEDYEYLNKNKTNLIFYS